MWDIVKYQRLTEYISQNSKRSTSSDEDLAYIKSRKRHVEDPKETEVPRIQDTTMNYANQEEDRKIEELQELVDPPQEKNPHKRKLAWVQEAI